MSLEGSWEFTVTHAGTVYRVKADDDRVDVETDDGLDFDATWSGKSLDDWTFWGMMNDGSEPRIPDDVIGEIESRLSVEERATS